MKLYKRERLYGGWRWSTNDWGKAHPSVQPKRRRWLRWLPLVLLAILALPLLACKDCEQLHAALVFARASGSAAAIEAAEKAIAKAGCSAPEQPPATPTPPAPVNCLTHPSCPDGQHCEQGVGCVLDPLPDPPIECKPGEVPKVVDGEVVGCDPAPPAPATCSIDGEPGPALPDHVAALGDEVNATMAALRPGCPVGSRCVLQVGRQAWQAEVVAALRLRGLCAGQHNPGTDEIAVATSVTAPREGWHVYAGSLDGPGTVVWSPGAARLAWSAPVTAPDPQPVPDPPATTCPAQPCPDRSKGAWQLKCKVHGRDKADCTPVTVRQEPFCRAIGMSPMADGTLRAGCPMRPDGHPERSLVEAWVTGGTKLEGRNGATCEFVDGNPFQFWQAGGNCRLCSADGLTCGEWM